MAPPKSEPATPIPDVRSYQHSPGAQLIDRASKVAFSAAPLRQSLHLSDVEGIRTSPSASVLQKADSPNFA